MKHVKPFVVKFKIYEPTEETWKKSAERFKNDWRLSNCVGSIDGKHVTIKCPNKSGSNYYCYLKKIVGLVAIVGADYKFICGGYGKNSDSVIFEASSMGRRFEVGQWIYPMENLFQVANYAETLRRKLQYQAMQSKKSCRKRVWYIITKKENIL
nr:unnamed protein product [Callosobruchus analis]